MEQLLVKLNSLYSELEYEKDDKTKRKIKRQIKEIERQLNSE